MAIPQSFITEGFVDPKAKKKLRRLMIGSDGLTNTGKTEFMMSCPGPGIVIAIDRGDEACLENPKPPATRRSDFIFKEVKVPLNTTKQQNDYIEYWNQFRNWVYKAYDNKDAVTVGLDGDSDSWELQRLAEFGKLTQVPPLFYGNVNAKRRAFYSRAYDSGKTVIFTNKLKKEYKEVIDLETGKPKVDDSGAVVKEKTGDYERQGFADQDYLFQVQLHHMNRRDPDSVVPFGPKKGQVKKGQLHFGIKILKCKVNMDLEGAELWDEYCNFAGLVGFIYPNSDPKEWGL